MVGLYNSGKTSIMYKLRLGKVVTTIPTIGFVVETVEYSGRRTLLSFTALDFGGRCMIRPLLRHYYKNTDALIFVVDSADREMITDACEELQRMLREDELQGVSLLVLANKQDLPRAMSVPEVVEKLGLNSVRDRQWYIQGCSANSGDGLHEGLDWLSDTLKSKAKSSPQPRTLSTVEPTKDRHTGRSVKDTADRDSVADTVSTADTETLEVDA